MSKLQHWGRAIDVVDPTYFVNGVPDVANGITGYEIMQ